MQKPPIKKSIQDEYVKSSIKLPKWLHSEIQDAAEKNGHSMNSELIARAQSMAVTRRLDAQDKQIGELLRIVKLLATKFEL